jgi:hypothetical protein
VPERTTAKSTVSTVFSLMNLTATFPSRLRLLSHGMNTRRIMAIAASCIAMLMIVGFLFGPREHEPEPEYRGRSLSTWVMLNSGNYNPEAREALTHFGTNALPYFVRWIQYEKPGWRKQVKRAVSVMPPFIRYSQLSQWLVSDGAEVRAHAATFAITFLDEGIALPPLRQLASNSNAVEVTERASFALAWIELRPRLHDSQHVNSR